MYTQTGRVADRKEGKTAKKTKREKLPKELDRNVLVPLTILNHPVYPSRFLLFLLLLRLLHLLLVLLVPPTTPFVPLPVSVSVSFVRRARTDAKQPLF